jgi:hypothetical protein
VITGEKPRQEKACLGEVVDDGVRELAACPAFGWGGSLFRHSDVVGIIEGESEVRLSPSGCDGQFDVERRPGWKIHVHHMGYELTALSPTPVRGFDTCNSTRISRSQLYNSWK